MSSGRSTIAVMTLLGTENPQHVRPSQTGGEHSEVLLIAPRSECGWTFTGRGGREMRMCCEVWSRKALKVGKARQEGVAEMG